MRAISEQFAASLRRGIAACQSATPPPANRKTPCARLGQPTGEHELIRCTTCQGNVRLKFPIHGCEKHVHCLPTYTGDKREGLPMSCRQCIAESLGYEPLR